MAGYFLKLQESYIKLIKSNDQVQYQINFMSKDQIKKNNIT